MPTPTPRQAECLKLLASERHGLDQEDERLERFCDDNGRATDTFNQCVALGWVKATHNDLHDTGHCEITNEGRLAVAQTVQIFTEKQIAALCGGKM